MRGRFFRRVALLVAIFCVLTTAAFGLLGWTVAMASHRLPRVWLPALPLTLPLAFALFAVLRRLRGATRPLGDVMEAAGQLAEGRYDVRVVERGPFEARRLARAFNDMAERLEAHEQQRRHLLAEITHELKTPLAVMQGHLEGLVDGVYPRDDAHLLPVLEEVKLVSVLVDDLRTLALAETGQLPLHRETVDLGALLRETVASFQLRPDAAGVSVTAEIADDLPAFNIDPVRVRQVLTILLTNARQHTPDGGTIRVVARGQASGSVSSPGPGSNGSAPIVISVVDTGSGIAAGDLPHIFDRFYKSPDSRGSGLGLAIARNIVALHGGQISAESEAGRGATLTFTLPAAGPIS
jgi:signal transduction histidine kinase